jgi:hypothetical protein
MIAFTIIIPNFWVGFIVGALTATVVLIVAAIRLGKS